MRIVKYTCLILLCLCINSCSAKKQNFLGDTKLILSIEERDFKDDQVAVYNFFENSIVQSTITHNSKDAKKIFQTKFNSLDSKKLEAIKAFANKLKVLDYENSFPWKEGLYDRGNVFKISFIASKDLEYLKRSKKDTQSIDFEKILYYYEGHQDSPKLFKDLISYIKEL